ncbi:disulfide bond formation protein B [Afifella sp. IM 167]|uniref:disulfide bond formation protein B n=1 Tax=Afifella sp. IM 167 TaxID=2033586 RepID=UPI001CCFBAC9|nr:disulfide bond formation protein B [Afifella sp. IM 167]MBZ8135349.1 disulfide bond formation protein B [Afifella sp. IM 167]
MAALIRSPRALALILLVASAATILTFLGYEHIGGYEPCALCLRERIPYYIALPLAAVTLAAAFVKAPPPLLALLFGLLTLLMLVSAWLGIYHAGVEWHFWEGPATCGATSGPSSAGSMLNSLQAGHVGPSCDEAVWRFLGLSFAGWNVLASAFLFVVAFLGIKASARKA